MSCLFPHHNHSLSSTILTSLRSLLIYLRSIQPPQTLNMHFSQILLSGLVASSVSAIDVRRYVTQRACNGNYIYCPNLQPNTCCGDNSGSNVYGAIACVAVPTNWNIECRGHNGANCAGLSQLQRNFGGDFVCLTNGPFSGGGYGFVNKKRGVSGEETSSEDCVAPAGAGFGDGTTYNLEAMTEEQRAQL